MFNWGLCASQAASFARFCESVGKLQNESQDTQASINNLKKEINRKKRKLVEIEEQKKKIRQVRVAVSWRDWTEQTFFFIVFQDLNACANNLQPLLRSVRSSSSAISSETAGAPVSTSSGASETPTSSLNERDAAESPQSDEKKVPVAHPAAQVASESKLVAKKVHMVAMDPSEEALVEPVPCFILHETREPSNVVVLIISSSTQRPEVHSRILRTALNPIPVASPDVATAFRAQLHKAFSRPLDFGDWRSSSQYSFGTRVLHTGGDKRKVYVVLARCQETGSLENIPRYLLANNVKSQPYEPITRFGKHPTFEKRQKSLTLCVHGGSDRVPGRPRNNYQGVFIRLGQVGAMGVRQQT